MGIWAPLHDKLQTYTTPIRRDPVEAGAWSQLARLLTLWYITLASFVLQYLYLAVHFLVTGYFPRQLPRTAQMVALSTNTVRTFIEARS